MTPCNLAPWEHLLGQGTSHRESGRGIRFVPKAGERAWLFRSDSQEFREHFGNRQSCDAVFLIETAQQRKLFFIELKGRRFEDAIDQLAETYLAVHGKLPPTCRQSTDLEVLAVTGGGTPEQEARKAQEVFKKRTGRRLVRKSIPAGNTCDLRDFL
ncbi:hypothetical protein F0U62_00385 [Cystobacter fuscus]|uniref:hypothetical protein n=1 Tax=Cystobacter fuscus TaxID=43 RepID=UPI002B2958DD|nr:hypothetical protein F0U62_00385 [Cystobacter fuscus]